MRHLYFLFLFSIFPFFCFGQLKKNHWFANGNALVNRSNLGHPFYTQITFIDADLKLGYFFSKNMVLGTYANFDYRVNPAGDDLYHYGYGPFFRLHYTGGKSSVYFESNMNYLMSSHAVDRFATDMNIGIGSHFFISDCMAINFGVKSNIINNDRLQDLIIEKTKSIRIELSMEYFFNTKNTQGENNSREIPMTEWYLKKGNRSIGIAGIASFDENTSIHMLVSKFKNDRLNIGHILQLNSHKSVDGELFRGDIEYAMNGQYYLPLFKNIYYSPFAMLGSWVNIEPINDAINPGFLLEVRPADVKCFFKNTIIEPAFILKRNFFWNKEENNPLHVAYYFSVEQFVSENISLKGELFMVPTNDFFKLEYAEEKQIFDKYYGIIGLNYFFAN